MKILCWRLIGGEGLERDHTLCVAFCPSAITQQQVAHGNCGLCAAAEECVSEIRILLERSRAHARTQAGDSEHNGKA